MKLKEFIKGVRELGFIEQYSSLDEIKIFIFKNFSVILIYPSSRKKVKIKIGISTDNIDLKLKIKSSNKKLKKYHLEQIEEIIKHF